LAPKADDIWFWAMAKLKGSGYALVKNGYSGELNDVDPGEAGKGLWIDNFYNGENDRQMENVLNRFPALVDMIKPPAS
jgi:hypothetical protein